MPRVIACPICIRPLGTSTHPSAHFDVPARCPSCGSNPRTDAPIEFDAATYDAEPVRPCLRCGESVHALAVVCHACKRAPAPRVHDLDLEAIAKKAESDRAGLARRWEKITTAPVKRESLFHFWVLASQYASATHALGRPGALELFRRSTRACALLVLHADNGGRQTTLSIDGALDVTVLHDPEDDIDEDESAGHRMSCLWDVVAVGDHRAARILFDTVPQRKLGPGDPRHLVESLLGALIEPSSAVSAALLAQVDAAIEALTAGRANDDNDDDDDDEDEDDRANQAAELRVLAAIARADTADLSCATLELLDAHFSAWRYESDQPNGAVSLEACAVARLASARGLIPVDSPYAPREIWTAPVLV